MKTKLILLITLLTSVATFSQKKWTLKEAVDQALEKNISIQQNKLNLELAKIDVTIARGNFLPNLTGASSGRYNEGLSQNQQGILSNTKNLTSSFNLNSSGTIFNGFRNTNTFKQAQLGLESSKQDLKKIQNDISLFVVNGFLNVLFAKENLNVAKVQYEISKKQIEISKSRFEAGAVAKGDLLNTQSTAAADLQNLVAQENTLNLALLNLAQTIQVPTLGFDVAPIELGTPSSRLLYDDSNLVFEKALIDRPEIEKAKLAIADANLKTKNAKGAYLPTLSYTLSLGSSYFHQFNNLRGDQRNVNFFQLLNERFQYGAGLSLNIPIFNRFQTKNSVRKTVINKEILEAGLIDETLKLKQTIEQAFLDAKAASKTYEAAEISLQAQKEAFKNAQERYNYGAITLFDFDQVRTRLVNAQGAIIRSKYDYVFKTKVLQFYSGELVLE